MAMAAHGTAHSTCRSGARSEQALASSELPARTSSVRQLVQSFSAAPGHSPVRAGRESSAPGSSTPESSPLRPTLASAAVELPTRTRSVKQMVETFARQASAEREAPGRAQDNDKPASSDIPSRTSSVRKMVETFTSTSARSSPSRTDHTREDPELASGAHDVEELRGSTVVTVARDRLEAVCNISTPERGCWLAGEREVDSINSEAQPPSSPLPQPNCAGEKDKTASNSQESADERRRVFLETATSGELPSPVMATRMGSHETEAAAAMGTGERTPSPTVDERTTRRSVFLRNELADNALQSAEKFLVARTLSSLEVLQSLQTSPMRALRLDKDGEPPHQSPGSSTSRAAVPERQDEQGNGEVAETLKTPNQGGRVADFAPDRTDQIGTDVHTVAPETKLERTVQHLQAMPRTPIWPIEKRKKEQQVEAHSSQASTAAPKDTRTSDMEEVAEKSLKRLEAKLMPVVKHGEQLERTRDFSAAITKYEKALAGFRREGFLRPKLAEKVAAAERRLAAQRSAAAARRLEEQRRQKAVRQRSATRAGDNQGAEGPYTDVQKVSNAVGSRAASAAHDLTPSTNNSGQSSKKKSKKRNKKKKKNNKKEQEQLDMDDANKQAREAQLKAASAAPSTETTPCCYSVPKPAAQDTLVQLQQDDSGETKPSGQARGLAMFVFVAIVAAALSWAVSSANVFSAAQLSSLHVFERISDEDTRLMADERQEMGQRHARQRAEVKRLGVGAERKADDHERLAALKAKQGRISAERDMQLRYAAEKAQQEQLAAERAEQERIAADKEEQERLAGEKAEQDRVAAEKAEHVRLAAEKAEQERIAADKAEQEEKAEHERLAAEKAEQERIAADKAEQERIVVDKAEQERIAGEKAEQKRREQEQATVAQRKRKHHATQAERERIALSLPQLTHAGCECLPVTYNHDYVFDGDSEDATSQVWAGCGSEGWCDVKPGCEHAQEAQAGVDYWGWDSCDYWGNAHLLMESSTG